MIYLVRVRWYAVHAVSILKVYAVEYSMYVMHHQLVRVRFGLARSEIDLINHLDKGTEKKNNKHDNYFIYPWSKWFQWNIK